MTAAPITATCTARVPDHLTDGGWRCNSAHFADLHVCRLPGGAMFVWPEGTADVVDQWRAVTGQDLTATDAARVEALGSAAITLQGHKWLGWNEHAGHHCGCGWRGGNHDLHVAEQLWVTGALDRNAQPVVRVVRAARAMAERIGPGRRNLTDESRELLAAVDALGGGS